MRRCRVQVSRRADGLQEQVQRKSVCAELAANLKAQGWTNDGWIWPAAVLILKRKRGEATLTIFVKPENGGSEVKIFTDGLSWDGQ